MCRATAIVLTRCDQVENLDDLRSTVRNLCPETPVRETVHLPTSVVHVASGRTEPVEWLRGREAVAVCGIGHPAAFFETLDQLGVRMIERIALRDHAQWTPGVYPGTQTIVTTEKDAVRVHPAPDNLVAVRIELRDWPTSREVCANTEFRDEI
jgi:tetraacyldisaccharide 4'-kinase